MSKKKMHTKEKADESPRPRPETTWTNWQNLAGRHAETIVEFYNGKEVVARMTIKPEYPSLALGHMTVKFNTKV